MKVEYRVRPVTRYIVTRYHESENTGGSEFKGEFDSHQVAYAVGYALAQEEHLRLGYPLGDERIMYPEPPCTPPKSDDECVNAKAVTAA